MSKRKLPDLRPVQNYIKVNDATVKDRFLLPLINELLDKVKDARKFTKMDIRKGYYNIQIREGDEWNVESWCFASIPFLISVP